MEKHLQTEIIQLHMLGPVIERYVARRHAPHVRKATPRGAQERLAHGVRARLKRHQRARGAAARSGGAACAGAGRRRAAQRTVVSGAARALGRALNLRCAFACAATVLTLAARVHPGMRPLPPSLQVGGPRRGACALSALNARRRRGRTPVNTRCGLAPCLPARRADRPRRTQGRQRGDKVLRVRRGAVGVRVHAVARDDEVHRRARCAASPPGVSVALHRKGRLCINFPTGKCGPS